MKGFTKFVTTTIVFFLMVLLLVFAVWKIVTWTRPKLCHNPNATTIVLGNSRIQFGFDDNRVEGTWNVGLNADNYNIIYWKLKTLHRYNPQISKVVLEVDRALLFNYFKAVEYKLHPYYWDAMEVSDWLSLVGNDRTLLMYPLDWVKIAYPVKSIWSPIDFKDLGIGKYSKLYRYKLDKAIKRASEKETPVFADAVFDELQAEYLDRIVDYCQDRHLRLEFINMPSYPTDAVKYYNDVLHQYIDRKYPQILFHDYEFMPLPDSCYADIEHINYRGAEALSQVLQEDLK